MKLDLARELPKAAQRAAEGYLHALATHGRDPSKWTAAQRQHQRELLLDEWGKIAGPATRVPMPELLRLAGKPVGTTKRAAFVGLWERFASLFDANVSSIYPKLRRNPALTTVPADASAGTTLGRTKRKPKARATKRGRAKPRKANPALAIVGNPAPSASAELRKAVALYRRFHGQAPPADLIRKGKGKGVWIAMGELRRIDYQPRRGARRGPVWFHHFKPGCILAASPDGKRLAIFDRKRKHMVDFDRGITR